MRNLLTNKTSASGELYTMTIVRELRFHDRWGKKKAKTIQKKWLLLCPCGMTNNFRSFQSSYIDRKSLQCTVALLPPESCINDEHRTRPIPHVTYISDPKYNLRGCMRLSSLHQEVTDLFPFPSYVPIYRATPHNFT